MKKVIFLLLLFPLLVQAQAPNDSVYSALQGIQKMLEEKNYTRIPNEDFDKALEIKLTDKVNGEVAKRIDTIRNIVFLVLGIIGGALLVGLRTLVKNNVEDQLKDKIKDVNEGLKEKMKEYDEDMKEKIKIFYLEFMKDDMRRELSIQKDELKKEIDPVKLKYQSIEMEMNTSKRLLLEYRIAKMKTDKMSNENYTGADFEDAKENLEQAEELNDKRLVALALTELSIAAYYTKRERDIESSISKYMDASDMDIKETVFINLAAGIFYEYAVTRDASLRTKGMNYINAALRKVRDYGEAYGLKLEFLMVDYEEAFESSEKEKVKHEMLLTMQQILDSPICSKEVVNRFNRVQSGKTEKKYIDMINELFPEQMKAMQEKANISNT